MEPVLRFFFVSVCPLTELLIANSNEQASEKASNDFFIYICFDYRAAKVRVTQKQKTVSNSDTVKTYKKLHSISKVNSSEKLIAKQGLPRGKIARLSNYSIAGLSNCITFAQFVFSWYQHDLMLPPG
jgi:hypothetical protein